MSTFEMIMAVTGKALSLGWLALCFYAISGVVRIFTGGKVTIEVKTPDDGSDWWKRN